MSHYLLRRLFYAVLILIGVNLITFVLFFKVNTPDDMARMQLGAKRVTPAAITKWKADRGYDQPLVWNSERQGSEQLTQTIFFQKSVEMFRFEFGRADDGRDIAREISQRMWPSLALALPVFLIGMLVHISFALLMAFFRGSYLDVGGVVLCVAMMSVSGLFYIIGGQYLVAKVWSLVPISGYAPGMDALRFLWLPVLVGVIGGIGSGTRWYRTIFIEEVSKDYVRTARAKGLSRGQALRRHVLRNAMIPVLTVAGLQFGNLITGAIVVENVFVLPGLGRLVFQAIANRDLVVVRDVVLFLAASVITINLIVDLLYLLIDPRLRRPAA